MSNHPDAGRIALQRLVQQASLTQKKIAAQVGVREDSFSKILNGAPGYALDIELVMRVLNVIGVSFADYGMLVERESRRLRRFR